MKYHLGLDIGSISIKTALLDEDGKVVRLDSGKITTNPSTVLNQLLQALSHEFPLDGICSTGVSGSGKAIIPGEFNWPAYSSSLAIAAGL